MPNRKIAAKPLTKLLVDGRPVFNASGGVGRVVRSILGILRDDDSSRISILTGTPDAWPDWPGDRLISIGAAASGWPETRRLRWEQWTLRRILRHRKPDVYWATWNTGVPWPCPVPSVLTVHDVIPLRRANYFGSRLITRCYRANLALSLRAATRIVAVSEASRRDLALRAGCRRSDIAVVHHGVDERFSPEPLANESHFDLSDPVILYVGGFEERKNVAALLMAFDSLAGDPKFSGATLALTGRPQSLRPAAARAYEAMRHKQRVTFLGYVDDDRLPALYRRASVFVFPSLEEGFGFPPLEAMACGTPVVVSGADSLPEVVGTAAEVIDARDPQRIVRAIESVLSNPRQAQAMREAGLKRAAQFRWAGKAQQMAEIFREAIQARP